MVCFDKVIADPPPDLVERLRAGTGFSLYRYATPTIRAPTRTTTSSPGCATCAKRCAAVIYDETAPKWATKIRMKAREQRYDGYAWRASTGLPRILEQHGADEAPSTAPIGRRARVPARRAGATVVPADARTRCCACSSSHCSTPEREQQLRARGLPSSPTRRTTARTTSPSRSSGADRTSRSRSILTMRRGAHVRRARTPRRNASAPAMVTAPPPLGSRCRRPRKRRPRRPRRRRPHRPRRRRACRCRARSRPSCSRLRRAAPATFTCAAAIPPSFASTKPLTSAATPQAAVDLDELVAWLTPRRRATARSRRSIRRRPRARRRGPLQAQPLSRLEPARRRHSRPVTRRTGARRAPAFPVSLAEPGRPPARPSSSSRSDGLRASRPPLAAALAGGRSCAAVPRSSSRLEDPIEYTARLRQRRPRPAAADRQRRSRFSDGAARRRTRRSRRPAHRRDARSGCHLAGVGGGEDPDTSSSPACTAAPPRPRRSSASSMPTPPRQQQQIRVQLADSLRAVVAQRLLPRARSSRPPARNRDHAAAITACSSTLHPRGQDRAAGERCCSRAAKMRNRTARALPGGSWCAPAWSRAKRPAANSQRSPRRWRRICRAGPSEPAGAPSSSKMVEGDPCAPGACPASRWRWLSADVSARTRATTRTCGGGQRRRLDVDRHRHAGLCRRSEPALQRDQPVSARARRRRASAIRIS